MRDPEVKPAHLDPHILPYWLWLVGKSRSLPQSKIMIPSGKGSLTLAAQISELKKGFLLIHLGSLHIPQTQLKAVQLLWAETGNVETPSLDCALLSSLPELPEVLLQVPNS